MGKGKGLPRASFNYNAFGRNVGMEGAASSHLLLLYNGRNGRIKGLFRASLIYNKICRNERMEGAASSPLLLP